MATYGALTLAVMARQARSVVRCCRAVRAAALQSLPPRRSTKNKGFTSFIPPMPSMWASPRDAILPTRDAAAYHASSCTRATSLLWQFSAKVLPYFGLLTCLVFPEDKQHHTWCSDCTVVLDLLADRPLGSELTMSHLFRSCWGFSATTWVATDGGTSTR